MPSRQLFIIRIALMTGVLMFAALTLYQRSSGTAMDPNPAVPAMRYVLWVVIGVSALVTLFLRPRVEGGELSKRGLWALIGWSVGEAAALLGTVIHFVGGPVSSLALGVLAFVFALMLLPVPRERS